MEDKPRYSRVSDVLDLIIFMLSKFNGVTLAEIQERFNVSRRTAERMRDAVTNILPQVAEIETTKRQKRWGFIQYSLKELVAFDDKNVAILENLKQQNNKTVQKEIDEIIDKIKALNNRKLADLENDVELLLRSEGSAIRQGFDYKIDLDVISDIRQAIKEGVKVKATYNNKSKIINPLGLVFAEKVHLIAVEEDKGSTPYNYVLHKLKNIELTNEKFDKGDFDIKEFAKTSFSVFYGEMFDVKLKFDKVVADDVLNYNFHPTQRGKFNEDGSYTVRFQASGDKSIIWNLFKWGDKVEILAPKKLKQEYKDYLENVLGKLK